MIKKLSTLLVCCVSLTCSAKDITQQQALNIAQKFFLIKDKAVNKADLKDHCQRVDWQQQAAYYVVNNPSGKGFVVVAGDNRAPEVLGYADNGSLDLQQAPLQLKEWLNGYAEEIAYLRQHASEQETPDTETKKYTPVAPLLGETAWNQLDPYNLMTPQYVGTTHAATGCAATAMAQIMYYHKYPAHGRGQNSYKSGQYGMNLSVDFSESVYDWGSMLPVYGDWDSEESRMAVALLMRDCGYAIDMDYGAVSGAAPDAWPTALVKYFDYDIGLSNRYRVNYALDEWNSIIYDEINAGRPVFAGGFASSGGHAFVFDGYDEDGLVHVNWGWGGTSNGYFRTSALTPAIQGTGGADGGFNSRQSIITGIQPALEYSELTPELLSSETVKATTTGNTVNLKLNGKLTNGGYCDITVDLGFGVYDVDRQLVLVILAEERKKSIAQKEFIIGVTANDVDLSALANGEYRIYPIAIEHGGQQWTKVRDNNNSKPNFLKLQVTDGSFTFSSPVKFRLAAKDVKLNNILYQGIKASVTAMLVNTGDMEYCSDVKVALFDIQDGTKVTESDTYIEEVYAQDSTQINIISSYDVQPNDYLLALIDENQTKLHEPILVTMQSAPAGDNSIEAIGQLAFTDDEPICQDNLDMTARLSCPSGVFAGNLVVYVYDEYETLATPLGSLDPQFVFIEEGQEQTIRFKGKMENGVVGVRYKATIIDLDNNQYVKPRNTASCYFVLSDSSVNSINDIERDIYHHSDTYDLYGRRMDSEQLPKGIYIRKGKKYIVR